MTCLRGASAVEEILKRNPERPVTVFAVWEPILASDWSKPASMVLRRLSDARVRQYWDKKNSVAAEVKRVSPHPDCCDRGGVLWDIAAVYAPGTQWTATLPPPLYVGGPVVRVTSALENALTSAR